LDRDCQRQSEAANCADVIPLVHCHPRRLYFTHW
jgi:hypothetical protein